MMADSRSAEQLHNFRVTFSVHIRVRAGYNVLTGRIRMTSHFVLFVMQRKSRKPTEVEHLLWLWKWEKSICESSLHVMCGLWWDYYVMAIRMECSFRIVLINGTITHHLSLFAIFDELPKVPKHDLLLRSVQCQTKMSKETVANYSIIS